MTKLRTMQQGSRRFAGPADVRSSVLPFTRPKIAERSLPRPRVLVVNKLYPPDIGGIENVAADIVEELSDKIEFYVLTCQKRGKRSIERRGNVTIERCSSWGVLRSVPISLEFLWRYRQLAPHFDLVHFHEPSPLGTLCGVVFGFPHGVVTFHSEVLRQRVLKLFYSPLQKLLLDRVDAIMPTSPNLAEHVKALRNRNKKSRTVPLGIDGTHLEAARHRSERIQEIRSSLSSEFMFLSVGRFVGYKGFEFLVEALSKLPHGDLVLVGDGPFRGALEQRAKDLGVANRVHFTGHLSESELAVHYQASDVFVLPSVLATEAFGLVQLEAMACGKPVINTDLPTGVPYVSLHGLTGLTVPPASVEPLAQAMRQLRDDSAMREAFGGNARRRYLEQFQRSRMAERVLEVYREVLGDEESPALPVAPLTKAAA